MRTILLSAFLFLPLAASAQQAEKQLVATITSEQLEGGMIAEVAWDGGALVMQGVFANPDGTLSAKYFVKPAEGIELQQRQAHTATSAKYWDTKANTLSPTGLGKISTSTDEKMPMYGIASQADRMHQATEMGGTQVRHMVRLGNLLLHERSGAVAPYDGEVWSWSPPELNRIAYVDRRGDLWIARADGTNAQRLLRGNFTLPAWSDDGRYIAVAERKYGGRKWEISIVSVPAALRQ